ncbi:MAG: carboxy-S-adenosyl-L-methionine synthase CmoA [Deltaproteobacteria bacterium]|nr:carboxy-S-adenosyl-L-methionine synthase CmoA [Deltaproteobacteria bacterium]
MSSDQLFAEKKDLVGNFAFDRDAALVFDDMLTRSVPFYAEIQRMIGEIAADFAVDGTNIYDLGCSLCTTFLQLQRLEREVTFIGIDASAEMLEQGRQNLDHHHFSRPYHLLCQDLEQSFTVENASVAILNLTLQFIRPLRRDAFMRTVAEGLNKNGCLILVEKVLSDESLLNRLFIKYYYELKKRNGYSELEIAQKREALENVLIPYQLCENEELLQRAGFRSVEVFFKWYNFCGLLALK